jgi:hypothetical protein
MRRLPAQQIRRCVGMLDFYNVRLLGLALLILHSTSSSNVLVRFVQSNELP